MIVRKLSDAERTDRRVVTKNWESTRLLLKDDGMGFSFHVTTIYAGTDTEMCYRHHLESVYCLTGHGVLEDLETGKSYAIGPGTIYILDRHDRHILHAQSEMKMACVFNPPLAGPEIHDESGAYPAEVATTQA
jgi:L-ectoine synthase